MQARRENISGIRLQEIENVSTKRLRELPTAMEEVCKEIHGIENDCGRKLKSILRGIPEVIIPSLTGSCAEWEQVRDANNIAIALYEAADVAKSYDSKRNAVRVLACAKKLYEKLGLDIRKPG
jgi:hypothetical protein